LWRERWARATPAAARGRAPLRELPSPLRRPDPGGKGGGGLAEEEAGEGDPGGGTREGPLCASSRRFSIVQGPGGKGGGGLAEGEAGEVDPSGGLLGLAVRRRAPLVHRLAAGGEDISATSSPPLQGPLHHHASSSTARLA